MGYDKLLKWQERVLMVDLVQENDNLENSVVKLIDCIEILTPSDILVRGLRSGVVLRIYIGLAIGYDN